MLKTILMITLVIGGMSLLFNYLLKQSKKPAGLIGIMMMKMWNKAYLPMVKWTVKTLAPAPGGKILDVGIGNGASTGYLAQCYPESQVIGIDLSEAAVKQAQGNKQFSRISFETKNIQETGYESASFSLICAFQTHFHWTDLSLGLHEIRRLLTEEGQLLIACEQAKINYFLPELKSNEAFNHLLRQAQLVIAASEMANGWVCYAIKPLD